MVTTVVPSFSLWFSFAFLPNCYLIALPTFKCLDLELNPSPFLHTGDPSASHQQVNIPHSLCKWWLLSVINLSTIFHWPFVCFSNSTLLHSFPWHFLHSEVVSFNHPQNNLTGCLPTLLFCSTYLPFQSHQYPSYQTEQNSLIALASNFTLYLLFSSYITGGFDPWPALIVVG